MIILEIREQRIIIKCNCGHVIVHPKFDNDIIKCTQCGARNTIKRDNNFIELDRLEALKKYNSGFELA